MKDLEYGQIIVRDGKGAKDRTTILPKTGKPLLKRQLLPVRATLEFDVAEGRSGVSMPAWNRKRRLPGVFFPNAAG